jgi:hypothetical protein
MKTARWMTLPLLGMLTLVAAGCGGSESETAPQGVESPSSAASTPLVPPPSPASASPTENGYAPLSSPEPRQPVSCAADIGEAAARRLVAQCRSVSPATRPPCNAANSCAMIRNEVARGCALLGQDAADTPECEFAPASREAAADLIRRFYAAVNAIDYTAAWSLWGPEGSPTQTLDQFAAGYRHTRRTHVEIGQVSDVEGAAGSLYATVPVTVDAELDDGRRQRFKGVYTLRQVSPGMGRSQGWHIAAARLKAS